MIVTCSLEHVGWDLTKNEGYSVKFEAILHKNQVLIVIYPCLGWLIRATLKSHFIPRFVSLFEKWRVALLTLDRPQTYLQQTGVHIVPQSPYSPDLNLCDRFLFTRMQEYCRAKEYSNGQELYIDAKRYHRSLSETALLHKLGKLLEHCKAVIREGGAYVTIWYCYFELLFILNCFTAYM